MAANITVDEGSAKVVATFEVSSQHIQAVAIVDSAGGKAVPLSVDATYGIKADLTRVPALPIAQDSVTIAGTAYTVKTVAVNATASGANIIIAAVSGKRYRILSMNLFADSSVTVQVDDGTSTLIQPMTVLSNLSFNPPVGYICEGAATNRPIKLTLGGAVNVRGFMTYVELTA